MLKEFFFGYFSWIERKRFVDFVINFKIMLNSINFEIEDLVKLVFYVVMFVFGFLGNLLVIIIVVVR